MNRYEITALASGVMCIAMTALMAVLTALYTWNGSGLMWVLTLMSATGIVTSVGAVWTLGQRRREAEAETAAAGRSAGGRWGADAQESALSEERERLSVVRALLERKLAVGIGIAVLAAACAAGWILHWNVVLVPADRIEEFSLVKRRADKTFVMPAVRHRHVALACFGLSLASLAVARILHGLGRKPGAGALAAEAGYHQIRSFAFLLAAGTLLGDTAAALPEDSYWRSFRWMVLLPPSLLQLALGGSKWGGLGLLAIGLIDDILIAGMAGSAAGDAPWSPVVAWLLTAALLWQAGEILWNAFAYRRDPVEGFLPVPPADSQGLFEFSEGRGLRWVTTGLAGNFGAEIEEAAARRFLIEHVGGTVLAVGFLFYMSTCFATIRPWEVGIRERFGLTVPDSRSPIIQLSTGRTIAYADIRMDGNRTTYILTGPAGKVELDEKGLAEKGLAAREPDAEILRPGLHFKFPWPIERIVTIDATTLQEITFGNAGHDHDTDIIMWSLDHYDKEFEMLTGDKMLASVVSTMHFRVKDPAAYFRNVYPEFAEDRKSKDEAAGEDEIKKANDENYNEPVKRNRGARHGPRAVMAQIGYRALTDVVSRNSLWALMAENRGPVPPELRRRARDGRAPRETMDLETEIRLNVQQRLDALGTGLEVVRVCLTDIHPPVKQDTAVTFEQVLSAMELRETTINEAQATANREVPAGKAQAQQIISQALADSYAEVRGAAGNAAVHKSLADVRAGKSAAARNIIDGRLVAQGRAKMLGERQLFILAPGVRITPIFSEEKTLEDVIGPSGADPNKPAGR